MYVLYIASRLIMVRSVFRVVEYLQGNNGYFLRHEVYLYIFDAVLMLIAMCLFNWVHPAQIMDLTQQRILKGGMFVLQARNENLQSDSV